MAKRVCLAGIAVCVVALVGSAEAQGPKMQVSGAYKAVGQSQHGFRFDADTYSDQYAWQILRLKMSFAASDQVTAVTRFDLGQGWWGVDNADRTVDRTGKTGASSLFDFKDTNFLLHVDQAYVAYRMSARPWVWRIGRQQYRLGHKIVLDNNLDGVQLSLPELGQGLTLGWALVSEGGDNLSDLHGANAGGADNRDANLFFADWADRAGRLSYGAFAAYYNDGSTDDGTAYVPDQLNFFKTRFSAQPTSLVILGLTGKGNVGDLVLEGEADYLSGSDDVNNTTHGTPQMWDINNGDVSGYNVYLKGDYPLTGKLSLGGVFGLGSGDDDVNSGDGNVNKIRTSGFFYFTEIWEDSIMPDEEGISPQGLGAPNVRGYRELENTTALQVNATFKATAKLKVFAAATYLQATEKIPSWTGDTPDYSSTSSALGQELDFRISYALDPGISAVLRGGVFLPGDGAGYLINGNTGADDPAWELKSIIAAKF